jgi:hypothetical protein
MALELFGPVAVEVIITFPLLSVVLVSPTAESFVNIAL